ncbi:MAG: preprotein translocase subunit SecF [Euryarchaeota archaeon]|nr:preprotein translocase subunit SecF [Euryarchaeota archaeon]
MADLSPDLSPRRLILPPLLLLLVCAGVILHSVATTGGPFRLGFEFQGGTVATVSTNESPATLEGRFAGFPLLGVRDAGGRRLLQFGPMEAGRQQELTEVLGRDYGEAHIQQMGEVMGRGLQEQTVSLVLVSFLLMALVVVASFRRLVPALAVVLSAAADMAAAMAFMRLSGTELSFGTLVALVMLIGYSVDTDILLTNRLLRGPGGLPVAAVPGGPAEPGRRGRRRSPAPESPVSLTLGEEVRRARATGLTMAGTTLAVLAVLLGVSTLSAIAILRDISLVLIVGLLADLVNTWMLNTGILVWYLGRPRGEPEVERPMRGRGSRGT